VVHHALDVGIRDIAVALAVDSDLPRSWTILEWARSRTIDVIGELLQDSDFWPPLTSGNVGVAPVPSELALRECQDILAQLVTTHAPTHVGMLSPMILEVATLPAERIGRMLAAPPAAAAVQAGLVHLQEELAQLALGGLPTGGASNGPPPRASRLRGLLGKSLSGLLLIATVSVSGQPVAANIGLNLAATALWEGGTAIVAKDTTARPAPLSFTEEDLAELGRLKKALDNGLLTSDEYEAARKRVAPILEVSLLKS
jgi:hypothetical protein